MMVELPVVVVVTLLVASGALLLGRAWPYAKKTTATPYKTPSSFSVETTKLLANNNPCDLFRTLFDNAPECVKLQTRDGKITLINRAGMLLLDTADEQRVKNLSVYDVITPEFHTPYRQLTEQVFSGQAGFLVFKLKSFSGQCRWLETNAVPLHSDSGAITGLLAITRDITEQKSILQELEEQKNRLSVIINSEPECVKLQDAEGRILEMNPAGLALLDAHSSEQVIGKPVYDFLLPEYTERYQQLTQNVFQGNRQTMEFEVLGLGGQRRWLETHATPLFDKQGDVSMLLAITRDIDERKQAEFKLQQKQSELAHVCRISTMGSLASSLAHELNQPLCAISSYAQSAHNLNTDQRQELNQILDKIVAQSERANQVIGRLRDFVREQEPQRSLENVKQMVTESIQFMEQKLHQHRIKVIVTIEPEVPLVMADRIQIEQVLLNLVSNASQALRGLPPENAKIMVSAKMETPSDVLLSVTNSGPNIAPTILNHLFTPFYTTKENGLGMGLVISRSIVEAHGGRLWHSTPQNGGACFQFTLPIKGKDV